MVGNGITFIHFGELFRIPVCVRGRLLCRCNCTTNGFKTNVLLLTNNYLRNIKLNSIPTTLKGITSTA